MSVETGDFKHPFKLVIGQSSPLILQEGNNLQIEGSGYISFFSTDAVNLNQLGQEATLKLEIRYKPGASTILSTVIKPPDWRQGEEGIERAIGK